MHGAQETGLLATDAHLHLIKISGSPCRHAHDLVGPGRAWPTPMLDVAADDDALLGIYPRLAGHHSDVSCRGSMSGTARRLWARKTAGPVRGPAA